MDKILSHLVIAPANAPASTCFEALEEISDTRRELRQQYNTHIHVQEVVSHITDERVMIFSSEIVSNEDALNWYVNTYFGASVPIEYGEIKEENNIDEDVYICDGCDKMYEDEMLDNECCEGRTIRLVSRSEILS